MAKFKTPLYYCFECKKIVNDFNRLFFLDEHSPKAFCSEDCIEDFHLPIVKHFAREEVFLREKYSLLTESVKLEVTRSLVDEILLHPDEVFRFSNELGESFYHVIKTYNSQTSVVVICSLFRGVASYIFGSLVTQSQELLNEYRQGENIDLSSWMSQKKSASDESTAGIETDENEDLAFMQLLENKKSSLLALLLERRKDEDIPIESFIEYDFCFQETLDHPDEVFEYKDKEGDVFFHYIKNYGLGERREDNFFYIVICLKRKMPEAQETMVYPVLGMPTNDMPLVHQFCVGKQISGPLKN